MREVTKIISRVADGRDASWMMNVECFDWNPGVFLAGAAAAYNKFSDEKILNYLTEWTKRHISEAYNQLTVNSTAPMMMILELYRVTGNEEYKKVCDDIAKWVITKAPITIDGGLEHTVTEDAEFKNQMWADTLFMSVLFLARYGKLTEQEEYTNFAAMQLRLHHKLLKDKQSGLFFHGWSGDAKNHMSGALWARANAWITLSTGLILDELPKQFDGKSEIVTSLQEQVKALEQCQAEDGGFHTVLDKSQSYEETSATAGFPAGIIHGVQKGILEERYLETAKKAVDFVRNQIKDDGGVDGVSGGTPVLDSIEDYFNVELGVSLYGQGLTLFMLCELH